MIILGCFGGTTIQGNPHMIIWYIKVNRFVGSAVVFFFGGGVEPISHVDIILVRNISCSWWSQDPNFKIWICDSFEKEHLEMIFQSSMSFVCRFPVDRYLSTFTNWEVGWSIFARSEMAKVGLALAKAVCFVRGHGPSAGFALQSRWLREEAQRFRVPMEGHMAPVVRQRPSRRKNAVIAHYMCRLTLPGWSQNLDPFVACWMQKTLVSMLITLHASAPRVITFCDHCLIFDLATSLPGRKKQMQRQERMCWMMPGACSGDEGAVGQRKFGWRPCRIAEVPEHI